MKRFAMALALACALSGTVLAGNIPTGGIAPPTPTETSPLITVILTIISIVAG